MMTLYAKSCTASPSVHSNGTATVRARVVGIFERSDAERDEEASKEGRDCHVTWDKL
jgi:hypothetical protein